MKVIYTVGKFRGANHWEIKQNINKAEALALEVWKLGHAAVCPHKNTEHFQGTLPDSVWLKGDLEILKRCDAVLCVDNWEESEGSKAEIKEATDSLHMPIFFCVEELKSWLDYEYIINEENKKTRK